MEILKRIINLIRSWFDTGCKHSRYGYIEADGFQYCISCNSAKEPDSKECQHNYVTKKVFDIDPVFNTKRLKKVYATCSSCGDVKKI